MSSKKPGICPAKASVLESDIRSECCIHITRHQIIMSENTRILFMGTPEFALPTLQALIRRYRVVGVITQPDRPAGRGRELRPPPVKQVALDHSLPVFQPKTLRTPEAIAHVAAWAPDVIVTAATGHILTGDILAIPRRGTLNVHASLLPRWRGAAPLQAAILAGDAETGVTIMCTDEGLDTGPILSQRAIPIGPRETAASLHDKLAVLGADLLLETLPRWLSGELEPRTQPTKGVTVARQVRKQDGLIRWERRAVEIDRQVRAYHPWPSAFTFWDARRVKIIATYPLAPTLPAERAALEDRAPGFIMQVQDDPTVVTGEGLLRIDQLQLAGKRILSGIEFVRGQPDFIGATLGSE
jgi:methionyl-tRNA formyltransferase